jgi:plasmid stabilization system protein ParE
MKFEIRKLRPAEEDELAAALWYDEQQPGLGDQFLTVLEATIRSLADDALIYRLWFGDVRRVAVQRFSDYGVFYVVEGSLVKIIAVSHGARHPRRLRERRRQVGWCFSLPRERGVSERSALASGCLLGAFIGELPFEVVEVVRLKRDGQARIGLKLLQAAA